MRHALNELTNLWQRAARASAVGHREYNPGWHTALDLENLLTVSEAVARAGLERKESRGAHFREDFPAKDEAFGKVNIVLKKGPGGEMEIRREPILELPEELKTIIAENQK